jgi:hypothetical protein
LLHESKTNNESLTTSIKEKIRIGPGQVLKLSLKLKGYMAKKKSSLLSSGSIGSSTGSMEYSKAYSKKKYKQRMNEEKIWQSLNGPITVRKIDNA